MKTGKILLLKIAVTAAVLWMLLTFVFSIAAQHGNQMFPAVKDGDLAIAFRMVKSCGNKAVVIYNSPEGEKRIGRIIGMPGDHVEIRPDGRLLLNGIPVSEEIFYPTEPDGTTDEPLSIQIPESHYFILNDHRIEKDDSRRYGAIAKDNICGEVFWLFRIRSF